MEKIKLKIKKLYPGTMLPVKGSKDAGCWDVFAHSIDYAGDGKFVIGLGFSTEFPHNYVAQLVPRSGITKSRFVQQNSPGQIDADYRGEWMLIFLGIPQIQLVEINGQQNVEVNWGQFPYKVGDRVGQMYFREIVDFEMDVVKEISETERGEGGFGSTGK